MSKEVVIDLGGTHLRIALVRNGKIQSFVKNETPKNKEQILRELSEGIEKCMKSDVKGIGVACAGVIEDGIIKISPNLPLKNFNMKRFLERKFKKKVRVENDANCVALAEAKYGIKKRNFLVLTLGTGIGGGVIINKELYKGKGVGGELGHIILDNGKDFEYCYKKSKKDRGKMTDYLGQGVSSLISIFDPEAVVFAGGMTKPGGKFLSKIKKETKKHMFIHRMPEMRFSKLENPGMLGASLLFES